MKKLICCMLSVCFLIGVFYALPSDQPAPVEKDGGTSADMQVRPETGDAQSVTVYVNSENGTYCGRHVSQDPRQPAFLTWWLK